MKNLKPIQAKKPQWSWGPLILAVALIALFYRSFLPNFVHFSNDGPLGQQNVDWMRLPSAVFGMWDDLNDTGSNAGSFSPSITMALKWLLGPVGYTKFYAPCALLILGLGAWMFFRRLKLAPLAATLGSLAVVLNSGFFAGACWGVAAAEIAVGFDFLALALIVSNHAGTPPLTRWLRFMLAGLCVGINVIEAADVGALCSILVALFVLFYSLVEAEGSVVRKSLRGISRVTVIAVFAGFIAIQTVLSLVSTSIEGVAGMAQNTETKVQHWDYCTQWSLPKSETLGLFVPGLFGYKMDTPNDMMPQFQKYYEGGLYWGGIGRDPALDRYFDSGSKGTPPPSNFMRFTGGGNYCGILVGLLAAWAVASAFRKENSPFTPLQKKVIWFMSGVLLISLPLAWGRFAPGSHSSNGVLFYALLYKLPYFSTIRNPCKFLIFFAMAITVLFAYGVHALQRHLGVGPLKSGGLAAQLKNWWARASQFDRRWTFACLALFGVSVLGWLIFSSQKTAFVHFLQQRGFPDENLARQIAGFSIDQAGWFVPLLAVAIGLLILTIAGCFSGPRAKLGVALLGIFLFFDLGRADLPYIIHWNYKEKYEIGTLNPIVEFLREKPYEHRVAKLLPAPLSTPQPFELFDELYGIEWSQQLFPYYNIQSLDIIQMPRMPEDLAAYHGALRIGIKKDAEGHYQLDETTFPELTRLWQLTNTRYLLGPAPLLDLFNQQFDPGKHRFRIVQRFTIALKPGVTEFHQKLEELTAYPSADGDYALIEFTGALPRAKLYGNWQVNTNNAAVLKTLADLNFDPAQTVLVDTPEKNLPAVATNENSGTVEFVSYAPKTIVFAADASAPSVLLLNDKYDPHWRVTVDGKPATLLRCNFLMRGVQVPPGKHTVDFDFSLPNKPLYVTVAGFATGILICGFLFFQRKKNGAT
jgi:hypothetical protein